MPTTWVTVWMCSEEPGAVHRGQHGLVQAATGGVGLVAVQCLRQMGVQVIATAGRAEKQSYVRGCGVQLVSTTRDVTVFMTEAQSVLNEGSQLGVVLNSLSHDEYIPSAAGLIAEGGWFVEIGKRGIWGRGQVAAQQSQVRYKVVAMDGQCALAPVWQHSGLQGLSRRDPGCSCEVQPLPLHVFQLQKGGVDGFRLLQQANQIWFELVRDGLKQLGQKMCRG